MITNTAQKIREYVESKRQVTANELAIYLGISRQALYKQITKLINDGTLVKTGTPPKVFYSINTEKGVKIIKKDYNIKTEVINTINENFTLLEPDGKEIEGFNGFIKWCEDRKLNVEDKVHEYIKLLKEYDQLKKDGIIDASQKILSSFTKENIFLDKLYYLYPYSFPVFGKTKMGQWLFHAKQTQNKNLMKKVLNIVTPQIEDFVKKERVDSLAFVPPTVPRNIQFMKELEKNIGLSLPKIKITKIKTEIMIQQKGLKDLNDRIKNAEGTMVVESRDTNYNKTLIIDDFTGSGSTLNILAKKIKNQSVSKNIIGLTLTGSMNGFEVIKEM